MFIYFNVFTFSQLYDESITLQFLQIIIIIKYLFNV